VIAFNWPWLAAAGVVAAAAFAAGAAAPPAWRTLLVACGVGALVPVATSILASWWVYDRSDLYALPWLERLAPARLERVAAFHAGFDEAGPVLRARLPHALVATFDLFDPASHTEASIRRARASAAANGAIAADAARLPLADDALDLAVLFLSAHEIRAHGARVALFGELRRSVRPHGAIVVVEHLRDAANFAAYSLGFLHFLSRAEWRTTFRSAGLAIADERRLTPFVTTFVLGRGGAPA